MKAVPTNVPLTNARKGKERVMNFITNARSALSRQGHRVSVVIGMGIVALLAACGGGGGGGETPQQPPAVVDRAKVTMTKSGDAPLNGVSAAGTVTCVTESGNPTFRVNGTTVACSATGTPVTLKVGDNVAEAVSSAGATLASASVEVKCALAGIVPVNGACAPLAYGEVLYAIAGSDATLYRITPGKAEKMTSSEEVFNCAALPATLASGRTALSCQLRAGLARVEFVGNPNSNSLTRYEGGEGVMPAFGPAWVSYNDHPTLGGAWAQAQAGLFLSQDRKTITLNGVPFFTGDIGQIRALFVFKN